MTTPKPRAPWWFHLGGLTFPRGNEGFVSYWSGIGVPADVIDWALDVSHPGAEDVANDRLVSWIAAQLPTLIPAAVRELHPKSSVV